MNMFEIWSGERLKALKDGINGIYNHDYWTMIEDPDHMPGIKDAECYEFILPPDADGNERALLSMIYTDGEPFTPDHCVFGYFKMRIGMMLSEPFGHVEVDETEPTYPILRMYIDNGFTDEDEPRIDVIYEMRCTPYEGE